jgi:hypothetical protein
MKKGARKSARKGVRERARTADIEALLDELGQAARGLGEKLGVKVARQLNLAVIALHRRVVRHFPFSSVFDTHLGCLTNPLGYLAGLVRCLSRSWGLVRYLIRPLGTADPRVSSMLLGPQGESVVWEGPCCHQTCLLYLAQTCLHVYLAVIRHVYSFSAPSGHLINLRPLSMLTDLFWLPISRFWCLTGPG